MNFSDVIAVSAIVMFSINSVIAFKQGNTHSLFGWLSAICFALASLKI